MPGAGPDAASIAENSSSDHQRQRLTGEVSPEAERAPRAWARRFPRAAYSPYADPPRSDDVRTPARSP
jgi:hypothetical protein